MHAFYTFFPMPSDLSACHWPCHSNPILAFWRQTCLVMGNTQPSHLKVFFLRGNIPPCRLCWGRREGSFFFLFTFCIVFQTLNHLLSYMPACVLSSTTLRRGGGKTKLCITHLPLREEGYMECLAAWHLLLHLFDILCRQ